MKKISVLIPTYNEQENVEPLSEAIIEEFSKIPQYDYDITFIDNDSQDSTRDIIRGLCVKNKKIKAIFNAKNFGQNNSPYYGITQTDGDCTIMMCADFQDPVEMIPKLIAEWEKGYKIVSAIKTTSKENKVIRFLRTCYYKMIKKFSEVEQIEHFTGFGLYDKSFVEVMKNLGDPTPFLRGIVAELGFRRTEIPYEQQRRRAGKTHNNFFTLYDIAMLSFTSYTKVGLRLATFVGGIVSLFSFIIAIVYLVLKLIYWDRFVAGTAPILIGMFFLGSLQLLFLGFMGEYILSMNQRIMNRPLVVEEERINF
ncbi:Glycosyltransferase involved in cell wall bisynthesis [Pseudobutyrivibrio sp. JW11]|uniref:glycosyltransferase family 2 protein n=1 Tax=Pseudobutyrivibrio sp. JW11 TaxID=1855302 RepID=UPI0008E0A909|nr:glycosyltransferase family 2 protein [Pseudobutyrivibrio sp. JW11]SFO34428.1 Glycosyltransferase involved in cell wall bisynthesis [Pseudobutyrivibrio sp. JW11]